MSEDFCFNCIVLMVCAYMLACMHVCVNVCLCVCVHSCMCVHVYTKVPQWECTYTKVTHENQFSSFTFCVPGIEFMFPSWAAIAFTQ